MAVEPDRNPDNDNGLGEDHCSCGAKEEGGPHTLLCIMEQRGLQSVEVTFPGVFSGRLTRD